VHADMNMKMLHAPCVNVCVRVHVRVSASLMRLCNACAVRGRTGVTAR